VGASLTLTEFERAVLELLLAGEDDRLACLREQLVVLRVSQRERTSIGAFVHLSIERPELALQPPVDTVLSDALFEVDGLDGGIGGLLWIKAGLLDCLELFAYGDLYPEQVQRWRPGYLYGIRDLTEVAKRLSIQ